jgi:hypothetical protein
MEPHAFGWAHDLFRKPVAFFGIMRGRESVEADGSVHIPPAPVESNTPFGDGPVANLRKQYRILIKLL